LPHLPQNFTPSANRELQFVQATIPGITLDAAAPLLLVPCEGDGWLEAPCAGRNCAWITCSPASSVISITRSSSFSPAFETLSMWRPGGMLFNTTRPELPILPRRSSLT
jgi:hypothetical protein